MTLTKTDLASEIEEMTDVRASQVKSVLNALAEIAADEVSAGEAFTVPGIVKLDFRYTAARKKGQMYKKGDTYVGFGGVEQVAEQDSAARKEKAKLAATFLGDVAKAKPGTKPEQQSAFFKSKAGKNVKARKA